MRFLYAIIISSLCLLSFVAIRKFSLLIANSSVLNKRADKLVVLSNKQRKFFKVKKRCMPRICLLMLYESVFFVILFPLVLVLFLVVGENRLLIQIYYSLVLFNLILKTVFVLLKINY